MKTLLMALALVAWTANGQLARLANTSPAATGGGDVVLSGLCQWWKCDEASGDMADSSGNGHWLTNNNITFVAGKWGNAAVFNGSSSWGKAANLTNLNAGDISISVWCYPSNFTVPHIICHQWNSRGPMLDIYNETSSGSWEVGSGATIDSPTGFTSNTWMHIVVTATGSPVQLAMWTNGVVAKTGSKTRTDCVGTEVFKLGGQTDGSLNYWRGMLDDIRIYNRVLSSNEIQTLYANP
jgi:hypothetical protein